MRELKRNLPIRLFLDILVSGYENRFYETCTYAKEKTYGTGFASRHKLSAVPLTWRQSVVPSDVPRDFGPVIAFGANVQIPVAR